ncbi:MAG: hypothetical protein M2R45_02607 [Verrucomicrobia subdivision 3 bacterium]|nr:hypothetical protein [Limisphaerales bacterium]MCS1416425.1 hypothetical protein [Limisphaerales bacterium]
MFRRTFRNRCNRKRDVRPLVSKDIIGVVIFCQRVLAINRFNGVVRKIPYCLATNFSRVLTHGVDRIIISVYKMGRRRIVSAVNLCFKYQPAAGISSDFSVLITREIVFTIRAAQS